MFGIPAATQFKIAEVEFHSGARVNHWQEKAAFGNMMEFDSAATPATAAEQAIARSQVIDLTSKMRADGTLAWDVPAGKWNILRMGYSLTGEKNHPATPEATATKSTSSAASTWKRMYTTMWARYRMHWVRISARASAIF